MRPTHCRRPPSRRAAAMHLGAAHHRRGGGVRRFLDAFVAASKKLKVGGSRRSGDRRRTDGLAGAADRRGADRRRRRQGARLVLKPERTGCILGRRSCRPRRRSQADAGGASDRGRRAEGRRCRCRAGARQFVRVRSAGRLLHGEPRHRLPVSRKFRVGSRGSTSERFRSIPIRSAASSERFGRGGVRYAMENFRNGSSPACAQP